MLRHIIILFICGACVSCELLGLHKGSHCHWNNSTGVCVSIFKCLSSFIDKEEKVFAPICCFEGKVPIICCTDCKLVDDTRKIIIDDGLGLLYKTGQKAEDACTDFKHSIDLPCKSAFGHTWVKYLHRSRKVAAACRNVTVQQRDYYLYVLGEDAKRAEFPHMALLGYGPEVDAAQWLCGGSVISERFILTAGHCLSHSRVGEVKYIALGILRRSDPPEQWQKYNVKRAFRHPEYKPPSKYNDIALLETDTEIQFSSMVRPACLHTKGEAEEILSGTGWGALGHKMELADTLQAVYINRFGEDDCSKLYPAHRLLKNGYNHTTQMCYGDTKTVTDSCEGDSGGPLQSTNYDEHKCMFTVVGVTSAGKQCGITSGAGLYTRVFHYVPWIESIVWP